MALPSQPLPPMIPIAPRRLISGSCSCYRAARIGDRAPASVFRDPFIRGAVSEASTDDFVDSKHAQFNICLNMAPGLRRDCGSNADFTRLSSSSSTGEVSRSSSPTSFRPMPCSALKLPPKREAIS